MPRVPRTPAERPPRRFWFDPRFGVGLVLILASVVGVGWIVRSADDTIDVLAATTLLVPGERVGVTDLVVRKVRLGESATLYLPASELPSDGLIVTRAIAEGELIPAGAVGAPASETLASVVVSVSAPLSQAITEGSPADLWVARAIEGGDFGPPSVLVAGATIARVIESDGLIVDRSSVGVEVLVPRTALAAVLDAMTGRASLSLIPSSIPVGDAR